MLIKHMTTTKILPTMRSSLSTALGLIVLQISIVKIVLALLNMDVKELMIPDTRTTSIRPRKPEN